MRLLVWNCRGALHKKMDYVKKINPDIAVIAECADIHELAAQYGYNFLWAGDKKGVAVLSKIQFYANKISDEEIPLHHHVKARIQKLHLNVIGLWTKGPGYSYKNYMIAQRNLSLLNDEVSIYCGDFNENVIWDKFGKLSHGHLVYFLEKIGMKSAYHYFNKEEHGKESASTLYFRCKKMDGFHIDYCFLSPYLLSRIKSVSIGSYEDWVATAISDHVPIWVDFDQIPGSI